jgi:hypothetical protein
MSSKRIFYACQAIAVTPVDKDGVVQTALRAQLQGVQSVGMNSNFNIEKIFQLGQLDVYDNVENNPEVEVTINKVVDGTLPAYLACMGGGEVDGNIADFANNRANIELGIYQDTAPLASGTASRTVTCTGMYVSSVRYAFPTEGNSTEDVTLVGNSKTWAGGGLGAFIGPDGAKTAPATARRWKFNLDDTVLPYGDGAIPAGAAIQSVNVSADFGRESIYQLGQFEPYCRYVNFPVEVTSEVEVIAPSGDGLTISAAIYSCTGTGGSTEDKEIKFVICGSGAGDSLTIDLGPKNRITSVNYQGGDTGGGNATMTYSFTTNNYLNVTAAGSFTGAYLADDQVAYGN